MLVRRFTDHENGEIPMGCGVKCGLVRGPRNIMRARAHACVYGCARAYCLVFYPPDQRTYGPDKKNNRLNADQIRTATDRSGDHARSGTDRKAIR